MPRDGLVGQRGPLILLVVLIIGCPNEPPEGGTAGTGTTLGSSSGVTTSTTGTASADETAGSDTTGGEGTIDCPSTKDPLPSGTFPEVSEPEEVSIEVSGLCDDIEGMGLMQTVDVELRHPATASDGAWPAERLPLLIFIHGNGQQAAGCVRDAILREPPRPPPNPACERRSHGPGSTKLRVSRKSDRFLAEAHTSPGALLRWHDLP